MKNFTSMKVLIFVCIICSIYANLFSQDTDFQNFEQEFNQYLEQDSLVLATELLNKQINNLDMWYQAFGLTDYVKQCLDKTHKMTLQDFRNNELDSTGLMSLLLAVKMADHYIDNVMNGDEDQYKNALTTIKYVSILNDYGFFLDETGQHQEAIPILKKVVEFDSDRTVTYLNLADAMWNMYGEDPKFKEEIVGYYNTYIEQCKAKGLSDKVPERIFERVGE